MTTDDANRAERDARAIAARKGQPQRVGSFSDVRSAGGETYRHPFLALWTDGEGIVHMYSTGGWTACETAADWTGWPVVGVTCEECLESVGSA